MSIRFVYFLSALPQQLSTSVSDFGNEGTAEEFFKGDIDIHLRFDVSGHIRHSGKLAQLFFVP